MRLKTQREKPAGVKGEILIFEAGLDDAAVELVKNAIVTVVRKNLDGNVHAYFCAATEEELAFRAVRQGSSGARVPEHQNGRAASRRRFCARSITNPRTISPSSTQTRPKPLDEYKSI